LHKVIDYPPSLKRLMRELERLPSIGPKTAERLAFFVLSEGERYSASLREALSLVTSRVKKCATCGNYAEASAMEGSAEGDSPVKESSCAICADRSRDNSVLCVVEHARDVISIERTEQFRGLYHVLGGVISPLEGVSPDRLNIAKFLERVEPASISEVIFALNPKMESEATIGYIQRKIKRKDLKLTRLASGIPVGADLEFTDNLTLRRAIESRNPVQDLFLRQ
jgi:recombination protein RecR